MTDSDYAFLKYEGLKKYDRDFSAHITYCYYYRRYQRYYYYSTITTTLPLRNASTTTATYYYTTTLRLTLIEIQQIIMQRL
ncbi:hypothetical protein KPH14_010493 [Odynerus spinipes]|uniref:Uncharacterized protein n=1 Tax=Odynerus spinipes TaxID=1348599 RepID=A0AAD9RTZ2_9HYME|nr:hypothetical protein KPH14_010493 [Odynerus spinipes]